MPDDVDVSELRTLTKDLTDAGPLVLSEVRGVIQHGALNIKTQLRAEMSASRHFKGIVRSITYDTVERPTGIEAEIGPEIGVHGGGLAHIAYFGGSNGGGGTVPDPQGALDAEAPNVERYLDQLVAKALW